MKNHRAPDTLGEVSTAHFLGIDHYKDPSKSEDLDIRNIPTDYHLSMPSSTIIIINHNKKSIHNMKLDFLSVEVVF